MQPQPRPLTGVVEGAARATERALARPEAREPLPLGAQAALSRALGADVGHVRLIRDAHAAAATAEAAADALAVGDAVLLSPGQDLASPRGLGLLAHELTHILRDRDPSFVPAVLRAAPAPGVSAPASVLSTAPLPTAPGSPADEEALAEQVEARVGAERAAAPSPSAGNGRPGAAPRSSAPAPWGDLPAPWEPLPFWDDVPAAPVRPGPPRPAARPSGPPSTSGSAAPAGGPGAVVRAASTSRSPAAAAPEAAPASAPDPAPRGPDTGSSRRQGRAPDLDRLAEQVYAVLKRRLATEMRRDR